MPDHEALAHHLCGLRDFIARVQFYTSEGEAHLNALTNQEPYDEGPYRYTLTEWDSKDFMERASALFDALKKDGMLGWPPTPRFANDPIYEAYKTIDGLCKRATGCTFSDPRGWVIRLQPSPVEVIGIVDAAVHGLTTEQPRMKEVQMNPVGEPSDSDQLDVKSTPAPSTKSQGAVRSERTVSKSIEMKGKAAEIVEAIEKQIGDDTGRSLGCG